MTLLISIIYLIGMFLGSAIGSGVATDLGFDHSGEFWPEQCPAWFVCFIFTIFWWIIIPLFIWLIVKHYIADRI